MKIKLHFIRVLLSVLGVITISSQVLSASDAIELYTSNTKISIPPGESVKYSIEVLNYSTETKLCNLSVSGVPKTWGYTLKSGTYHVKQIAIKPDGKQTITLDIDVPLKVNKGNYPITVYAGNAKLPMVIYISKQGSSKTEFTTDQANMQGHSSSNFSFRAKLRNRTGDKQLYSLVSNAPRGWIITFKPNYKQATSVEIEANTDKDVTIDVKPPQSISAGTYKIPVKAITNVSSAELNLEVVITGSYDLNLNTPTGLLSTSITAGSEKKIELVVTNTGSAPLSDIKFSAAKPSGWDATFEPSEIKKLGPGKQANIVATVKADKKAIAGDYAAYFTAKVPEANSKLTFRIAVKTPMIWGWIGILIIIVALGCIVYLFRKYGRR